ncbi:LptF/LptG family permease [bacterium]|nr:LptF/LptG family permease [bacterium]
MRILNIYILKEHVGPFLFGFFVVTFVLIMDFIIDIMDLIIDKGLHVWTVLEIFGLNLAWMLALSLPMAVLVASLMAFGRLSSDNEITAIKSSGTSLYTIIAPTLLMSVVLAFGMILFNNHVLPEFNHRARILMSDISKKRPTLTFKAGIFLDKFPGYNILIKKVDERRSELEDITIYDQRGAESPATIVAKRGTLQFSTDGNTLRLDLYDGEIHEVDHKDPRKYRRVIFQKHTIYIHDVGTKLVRTTSEYRGDREMSSQMMLEKIAGIKPEIEEHRRRMNELALDGVQRLQSVTVPVGNPGLLKTNQTILNQLRAELRAIDHLERQINRYLVEIHKKFSIPAACIVFVLIGAPLGIMAKKGGIAIGTGLSLGFFILYWAFLIGGEELADRRIISPLWAMWSPNILIGGTGVYLVRRMVIESTFISWGWAKRLIPRRFRKTPLPGQV